MYERTILNLHFCTLFRIRVALFVVGKNAQTETVGDA